MPANHAAFDALPVRFVTVGARGEQLAFHVAGGLGNSEQVPLLCLPGYSRNMTDFSEFVTLFQRAMGAEWPVVLVDLRGRGRSSDRVRGAAHTTINDAEDVLALVRALAIEAAIVVGEGHGGQVAMALALQRPALLAATVLIDAGPAAAPQSLIRLRSNNRAIAGSRGAAGLTVMLRRMLQADYPGRDTTELDRLAGRLLTIDEHGRARPLFDGALIDRLKDLAYDDVLVPQWQLFDLLGGKPMLLVNTELTDQVPREVLEEMRRRRPDAATLTIAAQGSPALLDRDDAVEPIADFVRSVVGQPMRHAKRA
jgi:pimeloyl-ACP methyl ester carboxylesterase